MIVNDVRDQLPRNPDKKKVYKTRPMDSICKIILHCLDSNQTMQQVALYDITPNPKHHIDVKGCPGFTYHYFIDIDGEKYYTSDITNITWHVGNHNADSIGIALRYKATNNPLPPAEVMMKSAIEICTDLCLGLGLNPNVIQGHRELFGTGYIIEDGIKKLRKTCPGLLVNLANFRYTVCKEVQKKLTSLGLYDGEVDGVFGPKSMVALEICRNQKGCSL